MEIVLKLCADHGPAASGAHNTIVTARAGKDSMSAAVSGILTIGPRFGGAVAGAALMFKAAQDAGLSADGFIADLKKRTLRSRVLVTASRASRTPICALNCSKQYARKNFPRTRLLDYALEVELLTTAKKDTLILNVDGAIGVLSVDMMYTAFGWMKKEFRPSSTAVVSTACSARPHHRHDRSLHGSGAARKPTLPPPLG